VDTGLQGRVRLDQVESGSVGQYGHFLISRLREQESTRKFYGETKWEMHVRLVRDVLCVFAGLRHTKYVTSLYKTRDV